MSHIPSQAAQMAEEIGWERLGERAAEVREMLGVPATSEMSDEIDTKIAELQSLLDAHKNRSDNPHSVTADQSGAAHSSHTHVWDDVTGKPSTYPPSAHTHPASDVTGLASVATTGAYSSLSGKPTSIAPTAHTHPWSDITSVPDASTTTKGVVVLATDGETTAGEAVQGSDGRLSNQRTPTDGSVTNTKVASDAAIAESKLSLATDAAAGTGSRRTLGAGAQQAAAGNHTHSDVTGSTSGFATAAMYNKLAAMPSAYALGTANFAGVALGGADVVVTLSPSMPDANYQAWASIEGTNVALGNINPTVKSKTASTVTVRLNTGILISVGGTVQVFAVKA